MEKRNALTCRKKAAGWKSPIVVDEGFASATPCPECGVIHGRSIAEVLAAAIGCDRVQHAHLGYCVRCIAPQGGAS